MAKRRHSKCYPLDKLTHACHTCSPHLSLPAPTEPTVGERVFNMCWACWKRLFACVLALRFTREKQSLLYSFFHVFVNQDIKFVWILLVKYEDLYTLENWIYHSKASLFHGIFILLSVQNLIFHYKVKIKYNILLLAFNEEMVWYSQTWVINMVK